MSQGADKQTGRPDVALSFATPEMFRTSFVSDAQTGSNFHDGGVCEQ
jgi:hypothetical protein